ncbi:hypothetical protein BDQ17DRAFT_1378503, partial [Cyathus striatus]
MPPSSTQGVYLFENRSYPSGDHLALRRIRDIAMVLHIEVFPFHLGTAYLMGFDFARKEDEASSRTGDDEWNKNLYRHPERYGIHPEANFNMLHDIYNLGVVLLEIALWRSFVACKFTDKTTGKLKSPRIFKKC